MMYVFPGLFLFLNKGGRIPWWSSAKYAMLSLSRAWVRFLIGELRSHKPHSITKKKKNKQIIKVGVTLDILFYNVGFHLSW